VLQWRAELGDEWMMGETVKPLGEQGIKMPGVDKIKRTVEVQLVVQSLNLLH